jgi:DNA (cytosine-5)-methyltransferase 1
MQERVYSRKPIALDLFSGCGGLTQGLKDAGFNVIGAVEIDHLAVETYKANHPEVEVWERDIRDINVIEIKSKLNIGKWELDLLAGCPPCQGFSTMRTLNGARKVEDPRNDLLFDFLRFAEELMPKTIMLENVPGLRKDKRFKAFCSRLEDIGYIVNDAILNAENYGVPQRRKRLICIMGYKKKIEFTRPFTRKYTVFQTIGSLPEPGLSGDPIHDLPEKRSPEVMARIRKIPKDGGSRTDLPEEDQLGCHKRCKGFKDVYGRMAWNDVAPTITSGCFNPSKGRFLHPEADRAITLREAALLQGFPEWYKFPITNSKSALALMIGNALPPPFITAHAKNIKRVLCNKTGPSYQ